jgi:DNA invertase Pin-like site-specific DNA recombinase
MAMEYIKQQINTSAPITHLFMTECSRLSRSKSLYDTLDLEREIQSLGTRIVFVNMSALNNEDSGSQLLKTVSYYAASQESERISERTITGMKNRIMEGYWPFHRPIGYKSLKVMLPSGKEEVSMQRDEPKASILAKGLEKFAS